MADQAQPFQDVPTRTQRRSRDAKPRSSGSQAARSSRTLGLKKVVEASRASGGHADGAHCELLVEPDEKELARLHNMSRQKVKFFLAPEHDPVQRIDRRKWYIVAALFVVGTALLVLAFR